MSEVAENVVLNKNMDVLIKKHGIVSNVGAGTKFWIPQTDEMIRVTGLLFFSIKDGQDAAPYVRVTDGQGEVHHIDLGANYKSLETYEHLATEEGVSIKCSIAPRIPNPALTDKNIESVKEAYGERATTNIVKARTEALEDGATGANWCMLGFVKSSLKA